MRPTQSARRICADRTRSPAITRAAALAAFALLAACNDPGLVGVPEVRVASRGEVAACTHLTNIRAEPGLYGPVIGAQAVEYSRNKVLEMARDSGANTVVFEETPPGATVYEVRAASYRC